MKIFYLQADSNRCIFGDASSLASEGYPNRALVTLGAPLPVTTSSSISGLCTGLSGTMHPKTIGPRVELSSCIKPPYSLGKGTGSGPAIKRT